MAALEFAVDEQQPRVPPAVEIGQCAVLRALLDKRGARRGLHRGEELAIPAHLDVELARIGLFVLAARAGVLHHEALHRARRSEVHLEEQGPVEGGPAVGLPPGHAAVHGFLGPLVGAERHAARDRSAEREVLPAVRPVDLELVDSGHRLAAVGGADDVQADEPRLHRRLDRVGGRARVPAVFPDAPAPRRPAFLRRLPEPLLHVGDRLAVAHAVEQHRLRHAAARELVAPVLHRHAVPEEHERRQEREPVHPQRTLREERAAQLHGRNRPRLPGPSEIEGPGPPGGGGGCHATRLLSGTWYSASTFSSAGTTPSIGCPSRAMRPSVRANRSRSRVITSRPIRSSCSRISVM